MNYPSPDIVACKEGLVFAIECKATKENNQYLEKREVDELIEYARLAGARPIIAVRFNFKQWRFLNPADLDLKTASVGINQELAELRGITFEELTGTKHL